MTSPAVLVGAALRSNRDLNTAFAAAFLEAFINTAIPLVSREYDVQHPEGYDHTPHAPALAIQHELQEAPEHYDEHIYAFLQHYARQQEAAEEAAYYAELAGDPIDEEGCGGYSCSECPLNPEDCPMQKQSDYDCDSISDEELHAKHSRWAEREEALGFYD